MIIDVHSHTWRYPDHFSDDFRDQAKRARAGLELDLTVRYDTPMNTNASPSSASIRMSTPTSALCITVRSSCTTA